jgi:hypothetical protein
VNNNSAKRVRSPIDDDDDVETVQTAETETLLPSKMENGDAATNGDNEQDYPDTDNVSSKTKIPKNPLVVCPSLPRINQPSKK